MKIFFWQNIISPHQLDFLKALSNYYSITLIVEEIQDLQRSQDGWDVPRYDFLNVIIAPPENTMDSLFSNKTDLHVFSGISAYKTVYSGFKKAIANGSNVGLLSEPIRMSGIKGMIKFIRGKYHCFKYANKIKFIATTGDLGVETYMKFGFPKRMLFQWGYFVDGPCKLASTKEDVIFVGNLNNNKQILPLLKLFLKNKYNYYRFHIVGSGPLKDEISSLIKDNNNIIMHGRLSNLDTLKLVSKSKLLVIPSLHDGWGVVVNEALLCGTPVVASYNVGSSILVKNSKRGDVFETGNIEQLNLLLQKWSLESREIQFYSEIRNWAINNISPDVAVKYFISIINYTIHDSSNKPKAPWLKK